MVSLIVNAGGQSRRMGRDKALLTLPNGDTLLAHVVDRLASLVDLTGEQVEKDETQPSSGPQSAEQVHRIVVVANQPNLADLARIRRPVLTVADLWPHAGALGGIATGLAQISGWAMCVACDMPFVSPTLMRYLWALAQSSADSRDAVVPVVGGRTHPFHAVYHARLQEHLAGAIAEGNLRIADALPPSRTIWVDESALRNVDPELGALRNVNTPEEWEEVVRLFAKRHVA
jgi:molybdopterin-guanine dinucleotide biosynthesis protein A